MFNLGWRQLKIRDNLSLMPNKIPGCYIDRCCLQIITREENEWNFDAIRHAPKRNYFSFFYLCGIISKTIFAVPYS